MLINRLLVGLSRCDSLQRLIIALWLVLIAYWAISAAGVKRNIGGVSVWWREIGLRFGVLVLVLLALRILVFRNAWRIARSNAGNTSMAWAFSV